MPNPVMILPEMLKRLPKSPWLYQPSPCEGQAFPILLGIWLVGVLSQAIYLSKQYHPVPSPFFWVWLGLGGLVGLFFYAYHFARACWQYCPKCLAANPRGNTTCQMCGFHV